MLSRHAIMTTLVIMSLVLFTSSTTNALAISNEKNITDAQNYTITDDFLILPSIVGDIRIPIPDDVKAERKSQKNEDKKFERITMFGDRPEDISYSGSRHADFFQCGALARQATKEGELVRRWEPFFTRNRISDTMSARYCCNLLEYAYDAEMTLPLECRNQVHLPDYVMTSLESRSTCLRYDFYSVECFLVRWMYWWIPLAALILIVLGISLVCCAMKSRRNKAYLRAKTEEKKYRTSLVNGTGV